MSHHSVYSSIVHAVDSGTLKEPFSRNDVRYACPGFAGGTYNAFLHKHSVGNPGGASELFQRVGTGQFVCVRPFLYGLQQERD